MSSGLKQTGRTTGADSPNPQVSHTPGSGGSRRRGGSKAKGKALRRRAAGKPHPTFPLTPHQNGQFCKKIRGRIYYFGTVADPEGALRRYHAHCEALHSGEATSVSRESQLTVGELANQFLHSKLQRRDAGGLVPRTVADYRRACDAMVEFFGRELPVNAMTRSRLRGYRDALANGVSPKTLEGRVKCARVILRFAYDEELIAQPIRFERDLKGPTQLELRRSRAQAGRRDFSAAEIRMLLENASVKLKAMILLGINCGLGNKEVALLPATAIDLEHGWLTYPRAKTGIDRRSPLWPETCESLRSMGEQELLVAGGENTGRLASNLMDKQPLGTDSDIRGYLFRTRNGLAYTRTVSKDLPDGRPGVTEIDGIASAFRRLLNRTKIARPGLGFYGLRRTFETIGSETGQQVAVNHIMGHAPPAADMSAVYRQHVGEAPLRQVTDHVRAWLFGK